jgi:PAS domain-containing protein
MTHDDTATAPAVPAATAPTAPIGGSGPAAPLEALRAVLAAGELAVAIVGLDGSIVELNPLAHELFPPRQLPGERTDGRDRLRHVLDQIPQQLLADPEGGVWSGEIDFATPGAPTVLQATTVLVNHDPSLPAGGFLGVI